MTGGGGDFLSRVAARAVGAGPVIAPRLSLPFERDSEAADGFEETVGTIADAEPGWSAASARQALSRQVPATPPLDDIAVTDGSREPVPRRRSSKHVPVADEAITEPRRSRPPVTAQLIREPIPAPEDLPTAVSKPPVAARAPVSPDVHVNLLPPPAVFEDAGRARQQVSAGEEETMPDRLPTAAQALPQPVSTSRRAKAWHVPSDDPAPDIAVPATDRPVASNEPLVATLQPVAPTRPPVLQPAIQPRADRRDRAVDTAPPPAPVVNITIGRVDVRAHVAPAGNPKPKSAPRPEPQTLSDYLDRRNAGR